jgi:GrpB-like predicted nucleotidyltransferase (UPF0157 family)
MPEHHIEVVEYDPAWPVRFARECEVLSRALQPWMAAGIEHIGSTAVPGLCAKPVIDLMVPVHSLEASRAAIPTLEREHAYVYWPYKSTEMHWFCKPGEYTRTHHVHLVEIDSPQFRYKLGFRDLLRRDARLRAAYAELKRRLAVTHPRDREAYTDGKAPFIQAAIASLRASPP